MDHPFYWAIVLYVLVSTPAWGSTATTINSTQVYILIDPAPESSQITQPVTKLIQSILSRLKPGDAIAVGRVDTGRYTRNQPYAAVSLSTIPSRSNLQKRWFLNQFDQYMASPNLADYADITGGLLSAKQFFQDVRKSDKLVLLVSDLKEGEHAPYLMNIPINLSQIEIWSWNPHRTAQQGPSEKYLSRQKAWSKKMRLDGASWHLISSPSDFLNRLSAPDPVPLEQK